MLRADNVLCGTSTTGTGTLTLAAAPAPPGGMDFDKWLKATGFNFVSTNAVLVSYTIIEYTDSTFATASQTEKGIGTLTLGASITAATLARTTVQSTVTSLNSSPSPTFSAPTAITIGTAANTLVFVGASAMDVPAFPPYIQSADGDNLGMLSDCLSGNTAAVSLTSGTDYYSVFRCSHPMLVKRCSFWTVGINSLTGSTNNSQGRLYAVGTDGRPGKLLYDFGLVGSTTSLNSGFSPFSSGAAGNGFLMTPGDYWFDFFASWSGGTGGPPTVQITGLAVNSGWLGSSNGGNPQSGQFTATGGSASAADPANLTSWVHSSAPFVLALKGS